MYRLLNVQPCINSVEVKNTFKKCLYLFWIKFWDVVCFIWFVNISFFKFFLLLLFLNLLSPPLF